MSRANVRFVTLIVVALGALALALWRAAIATQHLIAARGMVDDPSLRELEQAAALFEGLAAVVLVMHAAAAWSMARSGVRLEPRLMLGLAAYCAIVIGAALLGMALFHIPGVFPLSVALGAFTLSMLLPFSWLSIYLGVVIGGLVAWMLAVPEGDVLGCIFTIVPCVVYAVAGAGLGRMMLRKARPDPAP